DYAYRWTRLAVLSSLKPAENSLLIPFLFDFGFQGEITTNKLDVVRELADLIGARAGGASPNLAIVLTNLAERSANPKWQIATLEGLQTGISRVGAAISSDPRIAAALEKLSSTDFSALLASTWKLSRTLGLQENEAQRKALTEATHRAHDHTRPVAARVEDIDILSLGNYSQSGKALLALLDGSQPGEVQKAAITALRQFNELQ